MKIPGIPAEAIQPAIQATVARHAPVLPAAAAADTALPVVPVNPAEPAAGLRILLEEIRLAMIAELGALRARLPAPAPGEGPVEAAERATRFLRAALTEGAAGGRRIPQGVVERLLASAGDRALAVMAQRPGGAAPGTEIAIEEARQEIVRALVTKPGARGAPPPTSVPRVFLEQVRAAVEERLGMLPGAAAATDVGEADSPAEALAGVARLFRAAAEDPVVAVRASNLSLTQALELGAGRALAVMVASSQPEESGVLVADLRALASRQLVAGPGQAATAIPRPPADLPAAARLLQSELRYALLDRVVSQPPVVIPPDTADPRSLGASLVTTLALAARSWSLADARAARPGAEAALDVALRRTLLQLPAGPGREQFVARIMDVRAEAVRLMAAAESAAPRGVGWARPALEAAASILRGQEPPFRLDLAPGRQPVQARRGRRPADGEERVDPIESSDPGQQDPTGQPEGRRPD
jgi:hypothetical protein